MAFGTSAMRLRHPLIWPSLAFLAAVAALIAVGQLQLLLGLLLGAALFFGPVLILLRRNRELAEARDALRMREARLTDLADSASDWMWELDADLRFTWVSRRAADLLGLSDNEMLGRTPFETMALVGAELDEDALEAHRAALLARQPVENLEVRHVNPRTGRNRCQSISGRPVYDESGNFAGYRGVASDITERRDAERAQATSEARLKDFASSASDWFWETDAELRFSYLSEQYENVTGIARDRVLGKLRREIAGEDQIAAEPAKWEAHFADLEARRPFRNFEFELASASGPRRTVNINGVPVFDADGAFLGYRGSATDVTDRRRTETALAESEQLLRVIADNLPVWIAYLDGDLCLRFMNAKFEEMHGIRLEDQIGAPLEVWAPPRDIDVIRPRLETALTGEVVEFEREYVRYDGTVYWVRATFLPHLDDGEVKGLFLLREDITDLKKARNEALQYADQLQRIADGVPGAVTCVDRDHRYRFVNMYLAEWHGSTPDAMIGRKISEVSDPDHYEKLRPNLERALAGEEVAFEIERRASDGRRAWADCRYMPFRNAEGEVIGALGLSMDITEKKTLESQLLQSHRLDAVGRLTGGVAHDFNNLLLAIQSNLELIECDVHPDSPKRLYVRNALKGVHRAAELTNHLLAFSRQQALKPEVVDAGELVREFGAIFGRTLEETITLEIVAPETDTPIEIDPGQLENALLNLAINARDAMPGGGTLRYAVDTVILGPEDVAARPAETPGTYVRVRAMDSGVGMTEAIRRQAFEPFFTTKELGKGTGLGLSMVHGFVQQSGGFAEVDSGVGQGTTVSLYFPQAVRHTLPEAPREVGISPCGEGTVLLVEDNDEVREAAALNLRALGYSVRECANGVEARDCLRDEPGVDILLSDVVMPGGLSGLDLAEHARHHYPGVGIVLMTGYSSELFRNEASLSEDVHVLRKPFTRKSLGESIRNAKTEAARRAA